MPAAWWQRGHGTDAREKSPCSCGYTPNTAGLLNPSRASIRTDGEDDLGCRRGCRPHGEPPVPGHPAAELCSPAWAAAATGSRAGAVLPCAGTTCRSTHTGSPGPAPRPVAERFQRGSPCVATTSPQTKAKGRLHALHRRAPGALLPSQLLLAKDFLDSSCVNECCGKKDNLGCWLLLLLLSCH